MNTKDGDLLTNPIIEKFDNSNDKYRFQLLPKDFTKQCLHTLNDAYRLVNKDGSFPCEFNTGDYGYKANKIFPLIRKVFCESFGNAKEAYNYMYDRKCQHAEWDYVGYTLLLRTVYTHPKTDGWYISIEVFENKESNKSNN